MIRYYNDIHSDMMLHHIHNYYIPYVAIRLNYIEVCLDGLTDRNRSIIPIMTRMKFQRASYGRTFFRSLIKSGLCTELIDMLTTLMCREITDEGYIILFHTDRTVPRLL